METQTGDLFIFPQYGIVSYKPLCVERFRLDLGKLLSQLRVDGGILFYFFTASYPSVLFFFFVN